MFGEDNILLGQINMFSVITCSHNAVIAAADTTKFFKIMGEAGGDFVTELRNQCSDKLGTIYRGYCKNKVPTKDGSE